MARRKNEFEKFLSEVKAEAEARGDFGVLDAYRMQFRRAVQQIERRRKLRGKSSGPEPQIAILNI